MSGGSYNYTFSRIEEKYVGHMEDAELDELMKDIVEVTHDLEWWCSGDIDEEAYRNTVNKFKKKWFGKRDERLKAIVETKCTELKSELLKMIGDAT